MKKKEREKKHTTHVSNKIIEIHLNINLICEKKERENVEIE